MYVRRTEGPWSKGLPLFNIRQPCLNDKRKNVKYQGVLDPKSFETITLTLTS